MKITCINYIDEVISNQINLEEWRKSYPDGISVMDLIREKGLPMILIDSEGNITDDGESILLTDPQYIEVQYSIR